jgi:hypothetical protein
MASGRKRILRYTRIRTLRSDTRKSFVFLGCAYAALITSPLQQRNPCSVNTGLWFNSFYRRSTVAECLSVVPARLQPPHRSRQIMCHLGQQQQPHCIVLRYKQIRAA